MTSFFYSLFSCLLLVSSLFPDQVFVDREGKEIQIIPVKSVYEIDCVQGRDVLVRGFMQEYEDVPLAELNPEFRSMGDVRRFYERYFDSELEHYRNGELIWVQAFEKDRLLGWATFEIEPGGNRSAYMNLLVVDPNEWHRGIGKHLTFSILSSELRPEVREIRLLIRKLNERGRQFYEKIGFSDFKYERQDNFVDTSLLTGLRWIKR